MMNCMISYIVCNNMFHDLKLHFVYIHIYMYSLNLAQHIYDTLLDVPSKHYGELIGFLLILVFDKCLITCTYIYDRSV